jgi:hypothetical protein
MAGSIGSIFVDFVARTAGFQTGVQTNVNSLRQGAAQMQTTFGQVSVSGDQMVSAIEKGGLRIGAALMGASTIARAVAKEVRDVYQNIDNIPGVPSSTIESVNRMKYSFEQASTTLKQFIAEGLAGFANFGVALGLSLGSALYGADAAQAAFDDMNAKAQAFGNLEFDKKLAAAKEQLIGIAATKGATVDALREEIALMKQLAAGGTLTAQQLAEHPMLKQKTDQFALQGGMTTKDSQDLTLEATQKQATMLRDWNDLLKQNTEEYTRYAEKVNESLVLHKGISEQLAFWQKEYALANEKRLQGKAIGDTDYGNGQGLQMENEGWREMALALGKINELQKKIHEASGVMRDSFAGAFGGMSSVLADFFVDGKANMGDFFKSFEKQILETFLKLSLLNPLLNSLFGKTTGWNALPSFFSFGGFFANGGRPEPGKVSIVGEDGPEPFIPDTAGTILPNSALRALGSSRAGDTYVIDASGADQTAISRLEAMVMALNGSVERRSVASVLAAIRKGGATGRALAGA